MDLADIDVNKVGNKSVIFQLRNELGGETIFPGIY